MSIMSASSQVNTNSSKQTMPSLAELLLSCWCSCCLTWWYLAKYQSAMQTKTLRTYNIGFNRCVKRELMMGTHRRIVLFEEVFFFLEVFRLENWAGVVLRNIVEELTIFLNGKLYFYEIDINFCSEDKILSYERLKVHLNWKSIFSIIII